MTKNSKNSLTKWSPLGPAMPRGLSYAGPWREANELRLLSDVTYLDQQGERRSDQTIFDAVFAMIAKAERLILLDMFLFNPFQGEEPECTRALSGELTHALLDRKARCPQLEIIVITDPVNTVYGGLPSSQFDALRHAGVQVIETDLDAMPDSNHLYSPWWRVFIRPFGNSKKGWIPSPLGQGRVTLRSLLRMLNFKANHRKTLVVDTPDGWRGLITSANPHDGSCAHDNMAVLFGGAAVADLLESELPVLDFCGVLRPSVTPLQILTEQSNSDSPQQTRLPALCRILTERRIKEAILDALAGAEAGDKLDLLVFYLSDRDVVKALLAAQLRGVAMRVLLDPNKDAFGREKNGIPNRPVGQELYNSGIAVRWCDTHGEQCHVKTLLLHRQNGQSTMISGSANFTRRNLSDLNLETDLEILAPSDHPVIECASTYFDDYWRNPEGKQLSFDFACYAGSGFHKRWLYRFMEATGFCTF